MSSPTIRLRNRTNGRFAVLARVLPATLLASLAGAPVGYAQISGSDPDLRDPLEGPGDGFPNLGEGVQVDENLVVDLHVNDEDLSNVLQMLSIQSQRNIVTSKSVSATVTANLYSVTFYEALDAILHVNGYGYIEDGNFIYVYTLEELQEILEQNRQRAYKVIKLNYLNAVDAAEFVKPLLSEGGQIKTNGATGDFPNATLPVGGEQFANEATMVVVDYPEIIEEIETLLSELDTRPAQVLIEATILQSALNEANAFGVDFSIIGSMNFTDFAGSGGPLSIVDGLINGFSEGVDATGGTVTMAQPTDGYGSGLQSTPGNTSGPATFKAGVVVGDASVFVRLLDEVTDTTILSRPNILTLNRQPARVLVGKKVGYLSSTSTDTATTQTVEFLDTGTQLYVRPFVSTEGTIRMELKPAVSEAQIREATDVTGAIVTIPDELTNEMVANVMVRDGQTVVLGGLFRDNTRLSRRQVPFAGDLPVIGAAFRGHDDATDRSEIIFMIKPSIVADDVLIDQGNRAINLIERVVAGTREGLLPWSRSKRAGQLLIEANKAVEDGKYNKALHLVQRALRLDHTMGEAILIRDKILEQTTVNVRTIMDEVINGELHEALDNMPARSERDRRGNRPKNWQPTPEPTEVAEVGTPLSQANDAQGTTEPTPAPREEGADSRPFSVTAEQTGAPNGAVTAEQTGSPSAPSASTAPAMADVAKSTRETGQPEATQDWRTLRQEIRAEARRAGAEDGQRVSMPGQGLGSEPIPDRTRTATSSQTPTDTGTGYRYAESEDAMLQVLDSVTGEGDDAPAPAPSAGTPAQDNDFVSLNVANADLAGVFRTIGQSTGKTVLVSPHVKGSISVSFSSMPFANAISTVSSQAGVSTLERGGVTYVYKTFAVDLDAEQTPNWVWKAVELSHIDASNVIADVRRVISDEGQAETDKAIPYDAPYEQGDFSAPSAVVVFDLLPNAEQLVWMLQDMDTREGERLAQDRATNGLSTGTNGAVVGVPTDDH